MANRKIIRETKYGPVTVNKVMDASRNMQYDLTIVPDPATGWGISRSYSIDTWLTDQLLEEFAKKALSLLGYEQCL